MKAIEVAGRIEDDHRLRVDDPIPVVGPCRVRVLLLIPEDEDLPEGEWERAGARNPAFAFLSNAAEDVYTLGDGRPIDDEG